VILGGVTTFLIAYIIGQVLVERRQNQERRRTYDSGS
jgi:NADH:ubiquinone oxidoreductase subunit 3 (subunit A)